MEPPPSREGRLPTWRAVVERWRWPGHFASRRQAISTARSRCGTGSRTPSPSLRRTGRPRAARRRPDHARRARAGGRARGRGARPRPPGRAPCSATTTTTRTAATRCSQSCATRASASSRGTSSILDVDGADVGVVGTKGFVGGFPGAELPDFGEPLLREVYRETTREVDAIEAGLEAIAGCHRRIVLLHYAPGAGDARRRARADLGVPRLVAARGADRRAPARPRRARPRAPRLASRARSATCRSTTSPCT